ncbi:MAG: V-type ATP synthase subunit E [Nitrososphaerota archaeon]|nr:V-type ATP synthase subunit E [Nitrososphaerota archaeon]MCL5672099.1 V-type ATP synthase subunit E [Nitrososphaerota archaeon]MDG6903621.1 V-type ATP synthase subunit E [Nitrososphaerota archaeon]MDG6911917.1 V-type ATP synthase subunit E [Nitrososphaerota archaeon]MDG6924470.1 V-type ATP synthase subunit E [Nitrososphaerota archaeon]
MAAEALLGEVEAKCNDTIRALESEYLVKKGEVARKAAEQRSYIQESGKKEAEAAAQRERVRIEGAAKLQAKKMIFDATEKELESNLSALRQVLADYAESKEYQSMLAKMASYAQKKLGASISVECRPSDAAALKKLGVKVASSDLPSIGGFNATSEDGTLALDMTFEELLRTHDEDARAAIIGTE